MAAGQVCIPANKNHTCLKPYGIGSALKTKINVNLGTSRDCLDLDTELSKVMRAVELGAEAIMDLSSYGDTRTFPPQADSRVPRDSRHRPDLRCAGVLQQTAPEITSREWIDVFRMHAKDGVDFLSPSTVVLTAALPSGLKTARG